MKQYKLSGVRKMSQGERKEIVFKAFEELRAERNEAVVLLQKILKADDDGALEIGMRRRIEIKTYLAKLGGKDAK